MKLFVASIEYGIRYSEDFRLNRPIRFLEKLVDTGTAGDATPIGRDYILLERQGIISTEETSPGRFRFVLKKEDVVRTAKEILEGGGLAGGTGASDSRFMVTQSGFLNPETTRLNASLGEQASPAPTLLHDMLAAIREAAQRGNW